MAQKSVISLLVMMVVFVECGEDEPEKIKPKEVIDEGPAQEIIWETDSAEMVLVPAGSFEMGIILMKALKMNALCIWWNWMLSTWIFTR